MNPGVARLQYDFVSVCILIHGRRLFAFLAPGALCVFSFDHIHHLAGFSCQIRQLAFHVFRVIVGKLEDQVFHFYNFSGIRVLMFFARHRALIRFGFAVVGVNNLPAKFERNGFRRVAKRHAGVKMEHARRGRIGYLFQGFFGIQIRIVRRFALAVSKIGVGIAQPVAACLKQVVFFHIVIHIQLIAGFVRAPEMAVNRVIFRSKRRKILPCAAHRSDDVRNVAVPNAHQARDAAFHFAFIHDVCRLNAPLRARRCAVIYHGNHGFIVGNGFASVQRIRGCGCLRLFVFFPAPRCKRHNHANCQGNADQLFHHYILLFGSNKPKMCFLRIDYITCP